MKGSHLFRLFRVIHGGAEGGTAESPDWYTLPGGLRLQMSSAAALAGAAPTPARLALVVEALSRIRAMAAAHGTRTVVVLQPGKEETYRGLAGEPPVDMSASLRQALRQRAVEYLDLGPVFRKRAAAGAQLFFQTDAHPNATGHALISECVGAYLSGRMPEDPEGQ